MCQSKFILLSLTSETLYYFLSSFDQRNIVNTCNISHVGKNGKNLFFCKCRIKPNKCPSFFFMRVMAPFSKGHLL